VTSSKGLIGSALSRFRNVMSEVAMRLKQVIAVLAGALVLTGVLVTDVLAQRRDRGDRARIDREWVLLGEKEVGFGVDRDVWICAASAATCGGSR
jgi:hypothetical protein